MLKFAPSCLNLWRQIFCYSAVVVFLSICALAGDAPLQILSPSQGGGVDAQTVNVAYSYDPAVFGQSPKVEWKIDGLDAAPTRGMRVKGAAPQAMEKIESKYASETSAPAPFQVLTRGMAVKGIDSALAAAKLGSTAAMLWGQDSIVVSTYPKK